MHKEIFDELNMLLLNDLSRWFGLKDYVKSIFSVDVPIPLPPIICSRIK